VQELEKEVRRLVNENLKLKRQCKQVRIFLSLSSQLIIYSAPSTPSQSTISTWVSWFLLTNHYLFYISTNDILLVFNYLTDGDAAESGDGCTDPAKQQQERSHQENLLIHSDLAVATSYI
jgi:hypothetical protein